MKNLILIFSAFLLAGCFAAPSKPKSGDALKIFDGNQTKVYEVRADEVYENGKLLGKYEKIGEAEFGVATDGQGGSYAYTDDSAVKSKNLKSYNKYLFDPRSGVKAVKLYHEGGICEAYKSGYLVDITIYRSVYDGAAFVSSYSAKVYISNSRVLSSDEKYEYLSPALAKNMSEKQRQTALMELVGDDIAALMDELENKMCR